MKTVKHLALAVVAVVTPITACNGGADVATGPPTPVATTLPLAVPPDLDTTSSVASASTETATTQPTAEPTTSPEPAAESPTAAPTQPTAEPTTSPEPAAESPTAAPTASPEPASPQAGSPSPAAQPTQAPTSVPVAPATSGATIPLGDFAVVDLVAASERNISQLAPSGATMLWFWAPH